MKLTPLLFIKTYLVALGCYLLLDSIWLPLSNKKLYKPVLSTINGENTPVRWIGGIVAWNLLALIICAFGLWQKKHDHMATAKKSILAGALIGLVTYGVFNGTNYAILSGWTVKVGFFDSLWGMTASAFVSFIVFYYLKDKK